MLGSGDRKLVPTTSLRESEKKRCSVPESWMLRGGDKKLTPTDIWEGVKDLVNGNMFTHNRRSLSLCDLSPMIKPELLF